MLQSHRSTNMEAALGNTVQLFSWSQFCLDHASAVRRKTTLITQKSFLLPLVCRIHRLRDGGENLHWFKKSSKKRKSVNETCDDFSIFLKTALASTEQEEEGAEGARSQTAATAVSLAVSRCENHELHTRLLCKRWKPQCVSVCVVVCVTLQVQVIYIWVLRHTNTNWSFILKNKHAAWRNVWNTDKVGE